jgi:hypothetical protein
MDVISTKYHLVFSAISAILIGVYSIGDDASFVSLDANSDGLISYDEARSHHILHMKFEITDLNKDGNISISEFSFSFIK